MTKTRKKRSKTPVFTQYVVTTSSDGARRTFYKKNPPRKNSQRVITGIQTMFTNTDRRTIHSSGKARLYKVDYKIVGRK